MNIPNWKQQFFASTRGRIVDLLRHGSRTVAELAEELQLSENAVRAHLSTLERDGLVKRGEERRGVRRPFLTYDITMDAEQLFPKACDPILREILNVIADQDPPGRADRILYEVAHRIAANYEPTTEGEGLDARIERALKLFQDLGGIAIVEEREGKSSFQGYACPLSFVSVEHPEVCKMFEALLSEIIGIPVHEQCRRVEPPRCSFELRATKTAPDSPSFNPDAS